VWLLTEEREGREVRIRLSRLTVVFLVSVSVEVVACLAWEEEREGKEER